MNIEHFKIKSAVRKFDAKTGKFIINISYEAAPPEPTERVLRVAETFGLGVDRQHKFIIYDMIMFELAIGPGDIVYVTGDSCSGKT
ncbi:MAG: hypothetical protein QXX99_05765 [Candidatus Bathyarchaeia archaeon]